MTVRDSDVGAIQTAEIDALKRLVGLAPSG